LAEQKRRSSSGLQQPQTAGCEFARDVLQRTPLHYAAENGHGEMVQELANYSPNTFEVNAVDVHGFTPLHLAVLHDHRLVISLLLGMPGVDVNMKAPIMICNKARRRLGAEVRMISGAPNVSERLFPVTKVEPPASRNADMTLLHFAAKMGHWEALKLLLISSCSTGLISNINARDSRGCTALHFAAQGRHEKSVELLLQQPGILPNAKDNLGVTPLQHAVKNGHSCKLVVELLLEKEMRVHGSEKRKFKLLVELLSLTTDDRIHKEIAELLLKELAKLYAHNLSRSVDGTLVHEAARLGGDLHTQLIPLILRWRPGDANALDSLRQTPLHRAVFNAHIHAVKALFRAEKGWRLRATQPDKDGKTPLEYAVRLANKSSSSCICNLLLDRRDVMYQQKRLYDGFKNTANCTLVGGTLISGVAYMGWLQPPLGFTPDYNYPVRAPAVPPGTFESFADGNNPFAVKFFFFNGLAFFYAMAALFAVAGALIFMNNKQRDGRSVYFILEHTTLNRISYGLYFLLYLSVLSMCLAFLAAGFAVLAPGQRPRLDQILFLSFFFYLSAAVLLLISYILFCKIWKIARNYYMQHHTSGNAH
jgi:ankyrin repeat protein